MNSQTAFAVWITGLPASGKSSITGELVIRLHNAGIYPVVLESDTMRTILTPEPSYEEEERDRFYRQLVEIGELCVRQGVSVIFDATANRRSYRDHARIRIASFVEVFIECAVKICKERDPKGIYAAVLHGNASNVPGVQAPYEPPVTPEVIVDCREPLSSSADRILAHLKKCRFI